MQGVEEEDMEYNVARISYNKLDSIVHTSTIAFLLISHLRYYSRNEKSKKIRHSKNKSQPILNLVH